MRMTWDRLARTRAGLLPALLVALVLLGAACAPSPAAPAPAPAAPAPAAPAATPSPAAAAPAPAAPVASPAAAAPAAPAAAPAASSGAGTPSGRLVIVQGTDATTLDPTQARQAPEHNIVRHMFDVLVYRNDKMEMEPSLAESWSRPNDRTWQFKLRRDAKFQNGEPVNAEAVKFSIERYPTLKGADTYYYNALGPETIEIVDDYTVNIVTKQPNATVLSALFNLYIVPPKYYGSTPVEQTTLKPVGSGPYQLVEWVKDDRLTMEVWDGYWGKKPAIKTVVWRAIPEANTRIAELQTGGADIIVNVPPDQQKIVEEGGKAVVKGIQGGRRIYIGIRMEPGSPQANVKVRQAMNYAVNVEEISKSLLGGAAKRMISVVNPPNNDPSMEPYTYNPEKAKQLLAEAGYPDGFSITLDTPNGRYLNDKDVAQAVAADLTRVGIKTTVQTFEWSVHQKRTTDRATNGLYLLGQGSDFQHTDLGVLAEDFTAEATLWNNPDFNAVFNELRGTLDEAKRKELSFRAQRIVQEQAPWIFLYMQPDFYGVSKRVNWSPRADERILITNATLAS